MLKVLCLRAIAIGCFVNIYLNCYLHLYIRTVFNANVLLVLLLFFKIHKQQGAFNFIILNKILYFITVLYIVVVLR